MTETTIEQQITRKFTELFCPPEGITITGGQQLKTGNSYPTARNIDFEAHVKGQETYAIDVAYKNSEGTKMCKIGVIDIDENDEAALELASTIQKFLRSSGVNTLLAFSGRKGYHVVIVSEPVPQQIMVKALKHIKSRFNFKGESIPGDGFRCKIAPCLHQISGHMSYFFEETPSKEPLNPGNLPDDFYEKQLALMGKVTPTSANILALLSSGSDTPNAEAKTEILEPDLKKLDTDLAPCIKTLVNNGGASELGTYDKNNLTLAGYCHSKGIASKSQIQYAMQMAKNSEDGPVETTKTYKDKVRHFRSILDTPSVTEESFKCQYVLKARKSLSFSCDMCKAKPEGLKSSLSGENAGFSLDEPLAKDLLAYIIQKGRPHETIHPMIMPRTSYKSHHFPGKVFLCQSYFLILSGINEGATNATMLSKWMDVHIDMKNFTDYLDKKFAEIDITEARKKEAIFREFRNNLLLCYKDIMQSPIVRDDEWEKLLDRAVDLSMRYGIYERARVLDIEAADRSKDIHTSTSEFTHDATKVLDSSQRGSVVPLIDKADNLIEHILGSGSPRVPTPFRVLNDLLGGGFRNGGLYIMVCNPGGGKTTLSCQFADYAAMQGIPAIVISMEMAEEEIFVNSLARIGNINSAKIMSPYKDIKKEVMDQVGEAAEQYLDHAGKYFYIVEGDYSTSPARIASIVSMVRAKHNIGKDDPLLVVVDYLQLLSTGVDALDFNSNETPKISDLAVKTKQLARDNNVAVLAISDVTKDEQGNVNNDKEYTLNSTRGSNRIAHAADVVMALYSESSEDEGGKAKTGPWEMYSRKVKNSEHAQEFIESMRQASEDIELGGDGATVFSRLELIKNRAGQGRGSQFMLYHRAYHTFEEVELEGQEKAEGRG